MCATTVAQAVGLFALMTGLYRPDVFSPCTAHLIVSFVARVFAKAPELASSALADPKAMVFTDKMMQ